MKKTYCKPKKCGTTEGFISNWIKNEEDKTYHVGPAIMNLWQKCDGNRTLDDLTKLMCEENSENSYTPTVIKEMLNLLEAKKLITYPDIA